MIETNSNKFDYKQRKEENNKDSKSDILKFKIFVAAFCHFGVPQSWNVLIFSKSEVWDQTHVRQILKLFRYRTPCWGMMEKLMQIINCEITSYLDLWAWMMMFPHHAAVVMMLSSLWYCQHKFLICSINSIKVKILIKYSKTQKSFSMTRDTKILFLNQHLLIMTSWLHLNPRLSTLHRPLHLCFLAFMLIKHQLEKSIFLLHCLFLTKVLFFMVSQFIQEICLCHLMTIEN